MTSFPKFIISLLYLLGCWILIPASIAFIYYSEYPYECILFFIIACAFLLIGAVFDVILYKSMLKSDKTNEKMMNNEDSEEEPKFSKGIIIVSYLLGGFFFELASILYWPDWNTSNLGTWIFRFGSFSYLTGSIFSIKDLLTAYQSIKKDSLFYLWSLCLVFYIFGSVFYLMGGLLSQLDHFSMAANMWMVGSIGFAVGATFGFVGTLKS